MDKSFSERFRDAWQSPTVEKLTDLLTEDVVLYQPHLPAISGKAAVTEEFRRLFEWIPGTHSEVQCWREDSEIALIEHVLCFPVGKHCIRIRAVDRFRLRGGLGMERRVYFDQLALILNVLRHPSLWPGYFRYRLGR